MADAVRICPHYGFENVIFSKKNQGYVCEDCGRALTYEKPVIPMRIF
jgi:hypothetical protein